TARRRGRLTEPAHLAAAGVRDVSRVLPFVLLNGRRPAVQLPLMGD
ncbi:MAG: hypothetical protein H3C34_24780, partial [Caldilineaceae bacterium]|nr:hypothetical protein [Caldilineaceae bacterium]